MCLPALLFQQQPIRIAHTCTLAHRKAHLCGLVTRHHAACNTCTVSNHTTSTLNAPTCEQHTFNSKPLCHAPPSSTVVNPANKLCKEANGMPLDNTSPKCKTPGTDTRTVPTGASVYVTHVMQIKQHEPFQAKHTNGIMRLYLAIFVSCIVSCPVITQWHNTLLNEQPPKRGLTACFLHACSAYVNPCCASAAFFLC